MVYSLIFVGNITSSIQGVGGRSFDNGALGWAMVVTGTWADPAAIGGGGISGGAVEPRST
jgi:hypothetical protein